MTSSIRSSNKNDVLEQIKISIEKRKETLSESICLYYTNLLSSFDHSVVFIPVHNIFKEIDMCSIINGTLGLQINFPKSKIILITRPDDPFFFFYRRFSHHMSVLRIGRLQDISLVIKTFGVTKIYYPFDSSLYKQVPFYLPSILVEQQDIDSKLIKRPVLINCCYLTEKKISKKINIKRQDMVLLCEKFKRLAYNQITPNGLIVDGNVLYDTEQSVSILIGYLLTGDYFYITEHDNIFHLLYRSLKI